ANAFGSFRGVENQAAGQSDHDDDQRDLDRDGKYRNRCANRPVHGIAKYQMPDQLSFSIPLLFRSGLRRPFRCVDQFRSRRPLQYEPVGGNRLVETRFLDSDLKLVIAIWAPEYDLPREIQISERAPFSVRNIGSGLSARFVGLHTRDIQIRAIEPDSL